MKQRGYVISDQIVAQFERERLATKSLTFDRWLQGHLHAERVYLETMQRLHWQLHHERAQRTSCL